MMELNIEGMTDAQVRENFIKILEEFRANPLLGGHFKFYEERFSSGTIQFLKHDLGFKPYDVLITSVSDGALVTINFKETDRNFIVLNTSQPCTVRLLAGFMKNREER
jgi:hypothetical protein